MALAAAARGQGVAIADPALAQESLASGALRGAGNRPKQNTSQLSIPGIEIATLPVTLGRSKVVGKTVSEVALRERYGITVLAIRRDGRYITNVSGSARILTDDVLYLLGTPENIVKLDHDLR